MPVSTNWRTLESPRENGHSTRGLLAKGTTSQPPLSSSLQGSIKAVVLASNRGESPTGPLRLPLSMSVFISSILFLFCFLFYFICYFFCFVLISFLLLHLFLQILDLNTSSFLEKNLECLIDSIDELTGFLL